jgi:hypothetical protein
MTYCYYDDNNNEDEILWASRTHWEIINGFKVSARKPEGTNKMEI